MSPRPAVAIVGPTASGKTTLALAAAQVRHPELELVSIDAMAVYRGMEIGTAAPTAAERAIVPCHLVGILEPTEDASVVRFMADYDDALDAIAAGGHRPLLVGGTGLYVRAVVDGLEPAGQYPEVRAELEAEPDTETLHARLAVADPAAAAKTTTSNRRRVVRALEVTLGSGRPFSSFGPGLDTYAPSRVRQLGLRWDRARLTGRIEERFHAQLAAGFLDEVRALHGRPLSRTARQALGYRELLDHLDGRTSLDEAIALAITRTRQFAVRQDRWFRRDPRIAWVDIDDDPLVALPVLLALLEEPCV